VQGRGGIFPRRARFNGVPAISRHGETLPALANFAKCSLENAAGLESRRHLISGIFAEFMQVRQATIADVQRIAQIHVETWRAAYRGQMPNVILDNLDVEKRAAFWKNHLVQKPSGTFVAELKQEIIGFCDLVPSRDKDSNPDEVGEIAAVYIQPEFWHRGAGTALCRFALQVARQEKFVSVTLWVLSSNAAARKFYETMGFSLDGATKVDRSMNNYELHEVRYRISF
jgi:ribosomal protein S18 acetylase RimI-like enzyme